MSNSMRRKNARQSAGLFDELIVDNFAGGGGASMGIEMAIVRAVDIAINHDPRAVEMHRINHPHTRHLCEDVWEVNPLEATGGRPVGLAWFSPDCKHFSRAKGGKPVERKIRGLAWIVVKWARLVRPRVIVLENVREFQTWGPLTADNRPCPDRKGETFRRWLDQIKRLGYAVEWTTLDAADYGAPTHRKRLFLVARCDGRPIVWPEPTHGPGRRRPWRTAAECIDWSLPCPSIFERQRPLAEKTMQRIALGLKRFVLGNPRPFIVTCNHSGPEFRGQSVEEPFRTVTGSRDAHGLVTAHLLKNNHGSFGADIATPLHTITTGGRHGLVAAWLNKYYGTNIGSDPREPMPTVTANGNHIAEVRAFLIKYYGQGAGQSITDALHTVTSRDRFGLVTVQGEPYQIIDIGLRMLEPRELARAQGFPDSYVLVGNKTAQVKAIGNSVCPPVAAAIVRANYAEEISETSTVA